MSVSTEKSNNYILLTEREFWERDYRFQFVRNTDLILYIIDETGKVMGRCTAWRYFSGIKNNCLNYDTEFSVASSEEEAVKIIMEKGYKSVPILNNGIFQSQIKKIEEKAWLELGLLLKLKVDYNITAVNKILRKNHIESIYLMRDINSDNVSKYAESYLDKLNFDVKMIYPEDYYENLDDKKYCNSLIVDLSLNNDTRKIRKFLWGTENRLEKCWYLEFKSFLNFLNSAECSEKYFEESLSGIIEQYKYVVVAGTSWKNLPNNIINITADSQVKYNPYKERYEFSTAYDESKIAILLIEGFWGFDNEPCLVNGFSTLYYNMDYNVEYRLMKKSAEILSEIERQGIKSYVMGADAEIQALWKYNIFSNTRIIGTNVRGASDKTELFKKAIGYESDYADEFADEFYGCNVVRKIRNVEPTELSYAYTRHSIYNKIGKKRIFLFGCCLTGSVMAGDNDTISSVMAELLIDYDIFTYNSLYFDVEETFMYYGNFRQGDIVILMPTLVNKVNNAFYKDRNISIIDFKQVFDEYPQLNDNIWQAVLHCNYKVYRKIAEYIVANIHINGVGALKRGNVQIRGLGELRYLNEIEEYSNKAGVDNYIRSIYVHADDNENGAIVMNCNPFTLGHQYLIEQAAKQVDCLYVFVVEEDKSYFKFTDRIEMVRLGVQHIKNVRVCPSGRFVLSALTLPGYFEKESDTDQILDAGTDLNIFASKVAPRLKIVKRFVGEEPLDKVTAQYNVQMHEILPLYGIEVIEIPRKKKDNDVISASRVRKLLKEKKYKEIRKIVPETTYEYLRMKNYG